MTTTQTTDARIEARRADLTTQRAERLDPLDYPRTWTQRQVNVYEAETARINAEIVDFEARVAAHAALPPPEPDQQWLAHLTSWRQTIDAELLAMPPRIRNNKELEQQQRLTFSIRLIDFGLGVSTLGPIVSLSSTRVGDLMAASGYVTDGPALRGPNGWRGALPETEKRIKTLTKQRTAAQAALDAALLTDEERATREDEHRAFRETLRTMHIRMNGTGTGLVAYTDDDEVLDVADMTPAQRQAFEWSDAASR